ncbi:MAG: hypothetical protein BWX70_00463 [Verrucomicrobia bacterium ADurb.Bin070]|nr:MAG: hypothetical protein BWX70_00463 [Verrucomicrobia bacterium ADurb.Bin070]
MKLPPASRKRAAASHALETLGPVIDGSLCEIHRGGSTRWQLTDRPAGKTRTLYVPAARVREVRQWTANWKKAKELLKELSEASREELRAGDGPAAAAPPPRRTAATSRRNWPPSSARGSHT